MSQRHQYAIQLHWADEAGKGTVTYSSYSRDFHWRSGLKAVQHGSADPSFRGDEQKYNPEEQFLSAISSCHMLWYLHLCADHQVVVRSYEDDAEGQMVTDDSGGGRFIEVKLRPVVLIDDFVEKRELALALHHQAAAKCFIANSCNFPILHDPRIIGS